MEKPAFKAGFFYFPQSKKNHSAFLYSALLIAQPTEMFRLMIP
jgi:hypothetical protein